MSKIPGKCQTCGAGHPPVVKRAQAVARCGCGGKIKFPNREPEQGLKAEGKRLKGAKTNEH
jgi:hypothetical protein